MFVEHVHEVNRVLAGPVSILLCADRVRLCSQLRVDQLRVLDRERARIVVQLPDALGPVAGPAVAEIERVEVVQVGLQALGVEHGAHLGEPEIGKNTEPEPAGSIVSFSAIIPLGPCVDRVPVCIRHLGRVRNSNHFDSCNTHLFIIDSSQPLPQRLLRRRTQRAPKLFRRHGQREPNRRHLHHPLILRSRLSPILRVQRVGASRQPTHPPVHAVVRASAGKQRRQAPQRASEPLELRGGLVVVGSRAADLDARAVRRRVRRQRVQEGLESFLELLARAHGVLGEGVGGSRHSVLFLVFFLCSSILLLLLFLFFYSYLSSVLSLADGRP